MCHAAGAASLVQQFMQALNAQLLLLLCHPLLPAVAPPSPQSRLFKVVSFITGFKNSMKGVGYFIGAAAISFNYYFALGLLLALIFAAMPWAVLGLSNQLGRAKKENVTLRAILHQKYNVNVLSVAR